MGAAKKLNYMKLLRDLVPINALSEAHIGEVTKKAGIEDVRSGRYVFRKGDRDYQSVYLLDGAVELIGQGRDVVSTVKAGSEVALHPLAHKQPRQLSARASGKVTVARIDSRLMDVLLTWDESAGYDVVEIDAHDDHDDWMTRMLQSQSFLQLPPSNIHQLLMRLESVNASAGDTVVRQGEDGDYFYIVKNGRLEVTRKASANGNEVLLAELGEGACFGEEALVSEAKRNASVTMVTDGMLMRLSKDDFNELLRAPLVHEADFAEAQELVSNGAQWLDVRLPGEFENQAIKGSINLPLSALRDQSADLGSDTTYVVCCDTGRRSSAGAFVLSQRGFNVYTLKNGLMDVPNEALTDKCTVEPARDKVKDAEIIPFDADSKSFIEPVGGETVDTARPSPADAAQIDKLRSQLQARERQIDEQSRAAEQEKGRLQADTDVAKQALEASQYRFDAVEVEKNLLQEELNRLQQTLSRLQESADGRDGALRTELEQMEKRLDQQQQAHDKQSRELEQELDQLRGDYHELGQRSNAVAGERDAAVRELEQVRKDLASIQQQLRDQQDEASVQQESLKTLLEQQIQSVTKRADAGQSRIEELEAQLAANGQKLQEGEQSLQDASAREQSLQTRLEQAEQKSADELERSQSESSTQQLELNGRIAALEGQLEDQNSQRQQQSKREELEQRLKETQQSLQEAAERERQIGEKLEQGEGSSNQIQQALDQSIADADELRKELDEAKQQLAESEKQVLQLDSRLNSVEKEHTSDIASLREALTRAQDERENVSREQTRLMRALRKAERDLERERHDNETEIHRLHKELKEAAGDSSAGLAAELDAAQEQLKQGARKRDDLEIQLGERSAQMENAQAEAEKLRQQLQQARDIAHQAEQQLIEANQADNEEMTIRLDAEQQAQQALRDQLETVTSERNRNQEQLTVQNHELEELRAAVQQAQADVTANMHRAQAVQDSEQQVQELRELAQQLEQSRDEARNLQQQAQQEVDQLRAEAEVNRGLENMHASMGDSEEALHAELVDSKKNVDVAIRLRIQAEEKVVGLQRDVERLQLELSQSRCIDSDDEKEARIPSLDENDPQASSLLVAEFDDQNDDASMPEDSNGRPEEGGARLSSTAMGTADTEKTGGAKMLLIMLLAVGLAAAGAYWWFNQKPSLKSSSTPEDASTAVRNSEQAETELQKKVPQETIDKPKTLPSFVKGMSGSPIADSAEKSIGRPAAAPPIPAEAEQEVAEKPAAKLEKQPLRSFSETLKDGGTGPTIVEFRTDSFKMGGNSASPNFAERPRHQVNLKRFAIGKHEVTFAQYDQFAQATGRSKPASAGWGRGNRPVINVRWQDAVAYTHWLSEQTGSRYRLPTEAEWEFAARSGSDKRFWWGHEVGEANANCFDCGSEWSGSKTAPVGSFAASAFAVHDMAGNVMEWVQDCYRSGYAKARNDGRAVEFAGCEERVVRGGGFDSPADLLRSASRSQRSPDVRLDNIGFRVVREF